MCAGGEHRAERDEEKQSGAEGDRTPDLMTASHALSQLSYSPMCGGVEARIQEDLGIVKVGKGIILPIARRCTSGSVPGQQTAQH